MQRATRGARRGPPHGRWHLLAAQHGSSDKLAGKGPFPGRSGRGRGGSTLGLSRGRQPREPGAKAKAPSARNRATEGVLITPGVLLTPGAGIGGEGDGLKGNLPVANGGRKSGASFGVLVLAQLPQLLSAAPSSSKVHLARAGFGDADAMRAGVRTAVIAPEDATRLHEVMFLGADVSLSGKCTQASSIAPCPSERCFGEAGEGRPTALVGARGERGWRLGSLSFGTGGLPA